MKQRQSSHEPANWKISHSCPVMTEVMAEKTDKSLYTFLTPADGESDGERLGPGSVWRGFTDTTTSHGVPHVRRSVGVVKVCFWGLITTACVIILVYHLTMSSIQYFSYDIDVNVALVTRRQLTFPAVTICNLNPVKQSAVSENSALNRLVNSQRKRKKRDTRSVDTPSDCPSELFKQDGLVHCYWVPSLLDETNYETAVDTCEGHGGHLAILDSQKKIDHIKETKALSSTGTSSLWVWLHKEDGPLRSTWVWGDREEMTNSAWAEGFPIVPPVCAYIKDDYTWLSENCTFHKHVLCERNYGKDSTRKCYDNVTLFHDGSNYTCYYINGPKNSYDSMHAACAEMGDTMAVVDTAEKMRHLKKQSIMQDEYRNEVWISLKAVPNDYSLVWKWNGTRDLENYDAWKTGFPKTSAGCAVVSETDVDHWKNFDCSIKSLALCERKFIDPSIASENSLYPKRRPLTEDFVKTNRMMEIVADLPTTSKQKLGYTHFELILDCRFAGSKCYMSDFATFYDAHFGNCYIFNSEWDKKQPPHVQELTGTRYGLSLTLNIGQDDYVTEFEGSAGARIVVHPQGRIPFPKDEGVVAAPGQMTLVGIRQFNVQRLPEPFGNCTDTTERNIKRSVFEEVYPVGYSVAACYATCYQRYVIERCGCADSQYPMEGAAFDNKRVAACKSSDTTQDTCRYHVRVDYSNNRLMCACPLPCDETGYTYQTSSSAWPADIHQEIVKKKLASKITKYFGNSTNDAKLWRNLLKVKVYYEDFNYEKIDETPSYSKVSFVSDIGGILGLWIGCSVLSLFEFLELAMDFVMLAVMRLPRKRRTGNVDPGTQAGKPSGNKQQPLRKKREDRHQEKDADNVLIRRPSSTEQKKPPSYTNVPVRSREERCTTKSKEQTRCSSMGLV